MKENAFLGCFEISIFMKSGINNFSHSLAAMWRSFSIVAITFIFLILMTPHIQEANDNFHDIPITPLTALLGLKFILVYVITLSFIYYFCKITKRQKNIIKFISCYNWCSLINLVFFLPLFILLKLDIKSFSDIYPALTILSIYSYAIVAFIVRHVIDIPWQLAIFVTICTLAINQTGFELLSYITK